MDKGTWQAVTPEGCKESDRLKQLSARTGTVSGPKCTQTVQLSQSPPSWGYWMFAFSSSHPLESVTALF